MSTDTTTDTSTSTQDGKTTTSETTSGAGDEFKAITSQEELNEVIGKRLERERSKVADYDDLKAKAARLDEIEAANKSELEKAEERAAAAEAAREKAVAEGLRFRIAAKHGISDEDAELFLTGKDEDTLLAQAKRLADREADRKKNGNQAPREGTNPPHETDDVREFARALFNRNT